MKSFSWPISPKIGTDHDASYFCSKQGHLGTAFGVVRWCVASLTKQTRGWGGRFKQQMEQQKFG